MPIQYPCNFPRPFQCKPVSKPNKEFTPNKFVTKILGPQVSMPSNTVETQSKDATHTRERLSP